MLSRMNMRLRNDKGVTLLMVAASLAILLGMCALGIDLVAGYLARVQCQRAADAAALAGAQGFVASGCTSTGGCVAGGPQETPATTNALSVAAQNPVMGLAPTDKTVSLAFAYPNPSEPEITVTVYRDTAHSDALPTMFAKIFGIDTMNISATATAEAYNGQVGVGCIKPFLVPNCNPNYPVLDNAANAAIANPNCPCTGTGVTQGDCPSGYSYSSTTPYVMSYYVYPIGSANQGQIVDPGVCDWSGTKCTTGVVGGPWVLHNNLNATVPSQWYTIAFSTQSGQQYSNYIQACAPQYVACGSTLDTLNGKKVGPTDTGIETLINANGQSTPPNFDQGQDTICSPSSPVNPCDNMPFPITGGGNNLYNEKGTTFNLGTGVSDSEINVVLYDGAPLSSGGGSVVVQGYMSLFIQGVNHTSTQDNVFAIVMQVGACATGPTGPTTNTATSSGGSFIPVRLIRTN